MNRAKLNQVWAEHEASRSADATSSAEREARRRDLQSNAKSLGKIATAITNVVGYERASSAEPGLDARVSSLIPLGQLDGTDGQDQFAFARIVVTHGYDHIKHEHVTPRGVRWLSFERVTSDRISLLGIRYYAGDAQAEQLRLFAAHEWDKTVEDGRMLSAIEGGLAWLAEAAALGIDE